MIRLLIRSITFCICISATWQAQAEPTPEVEQCLANARLLYGCFSFSRGMLETSTDPDQKEKLRKISNMYLILATNEVVAVDEDKNPLNNELALKYGKLGESDFKELLNQVGPHPTEQERNAKFGEFANRCMSATKQ